MNTAVHVRAALGAALALVLLLTAVPTVQAATGQQARDQAVTDQAVIDQALLDQATALQQWRGEQGAQTSFASAATPPWAGDADVVPGSLLVTTTVDRTASFTSFAADAYQRATTVAPGITAVQVAAGSEAQAVAELRAADGVIAVEPNRVREFLAVPDDSEYAQQWSHQVTGIEDAWDVTTGSTDVLVAIADSGVVADHPDLGTIVEQVDASSGEIQPGASDNDPCQVGHGTWVAGVLGALGNNGAGVAGVNWGVSILDINTADPAVSCGGPTDAGTIAAIAYATQAGADVVNLSLGGPGRSCPTAMQTVIDQARAAGTLVIAASGNSGQPTPQIPASCNGAISVGATGPDDVLADYSTSNPFVDVVAPGGAGIGPDPATEILSTSWWAQGERTPEYVAIAGTSFATPYVSGLAALIRAVDPALTADDIESLLEGTATDLGDAGRDDQHGWGLVQADAVIQAAAGGDIPAPAPDEDFPVGEVGPGDRPGGEVPTTRISADTGTTEAISQAVAVSQSYFVDEDAALWGVVARADDYADALAGSSLTLGVAPLLFSGSSGPLAAPTAAELTRVLPDGATVYLLGGVAALPATLDAEIAALGFTPVRLAGPYREATAVAVADQLDSVLQSVGLPPSPAAVVVNREDWPDAIAAGQMGAQFGIPILLTDAEELSADTSAALAARELAELFVVGGTVRVDETTEQAAVQQAGLTQAVRLAGAERTGTVVAVSAAVEQILADTPLGAPLNALAVNLRRGDAFAHMLSATIPLGGVTGVFLPVEGDDGTAIPEATVEYATGLGLNLFIMGGTDLIAEETAAALEAIVETAPAG